MNAVVEIFGNPVGSTNGNWTDIVAEQSCPYISGPCYKVRKSDPNVSMGTCAVNYSKKNELLVICPSRLRERNQVFLDCIQLLTNHEAGNELHLVREVSIPGGSVDHFIVSSRGGRAVDFVGVELQALDTTGDWWPLRQKALRDLGVQVTVDPEDERKQRGINWKMTAKTILVQIHHKIQTFESVNRKLVLVIQDQLLEYMQHEFNFNDVNEPALVGDSMHIHAYKADGRQHGFQLNLGRRLSTTAAGVAQCLELQAEPNLELNDIFRALEEKMSDQTRLNVFNDRL